MNAKYFLEELEQSIADAGITAKVMFSQDDGMIHLWGDGWEFRFTPGALPVDIRSFGTPPTTASFAFHILGKLAAWSSRGDTLSLEDRIRLQQFKDSLDG